jgi:hypothetical protein
LISPATWHKVIDDTLVCIFLIIFRVISSSFNIYLHKAILNFALILFAMTEQQDSGL